MSAAHILSTLPHRFPMLLIDRVVELVPGERVVAHKAVTMNEPWYANVGANGALGYPAALLVESWCQAAGLLAARPRPAGEPRAADVMLFGRMSNARFGRDVLPGEVVEHRVHLLRQLEEATLFGGEAAVNGEVVFQVEQVVMTLRPAATLQPVEQLASQVRGAE